jgi:hypothetical protein
MVPESSHDPDAGTPIIEPTPPLPATLAARTLDCYLGNGPTDAPHRIGRTGGVTGMAATEIVQVVLAIALCSVGLVAKRVATRRAVVALLLVLAGSAHFGGLGRKVLLDREMSAGEIAPDYHQGVRDLMALVQRRHGAQIVFPLSLAVLGWAWSRNAH